VYEPVDAAAAATVSGEAVGAADAWLTIPVPDPTMAAPAAASVARVPATGTDVFAASGASAMIVWDSGLAAACPNAWET